MNVQEQADLAMDGDTYLSRAHHNSINFSRPRMSNDLEFASGERTLIVCA